MNNESIKITSKIDFSYNANYPWYFQTTAYDSSDNVAYFALGPANTLCPRFLTNSVDNSNTTPQDGGIVITCTNTGNFDLMKNGLYVQGSYS